MKKTKSKSDKIIEAMDLLQKALMMDEPHIQVLFPGGLIESPQTKALALSLKAFVDEYKSFYKLKKVKISLLV